MFGIGCGGFVPQLAEQDLQRLRNRRAGVVKRLGDALGQTVFQAQAELAAQALAAGGAGDGFENARAV